MNYLLDKLILLCFSITFYIQNQGINHPYIVVPVIIMVIFSALISYFENKGITAFVLLAYLLLCFIYPVFLFFLPLLSYDLFALRWPWQILFFFLSAIPNWAALSFTYNAIVILSIAIAILMKIRTNSLERIKHNYYALRDSAKEVSLSLERQNKELMEKQDYEINLATLNERNRIARDIHDNVGHLLSSSILQIGAMIATATDKRAVQNLQILKQTLSQGMDSIRNSVHDLHHQSVDLYVEVTKLISQFNFCPLAFDYDIDRSPNINIKYAFIAVIKEALSNIIRHSNATEVKLVLREHPALYQLIIRDNGTLIQSERKGLGLTNIADRVRKLDGILNISMDQGFVIFISVPKE